MIQVNRTSSAGLVGLAMALVLVVPTVCVAQRGEAQTPVDAPEYVEVAEDGTVTLDPVTAAMWAVERNTDLELQRQAIPEAEGQLEQARAADALTVALSGSAMRMGPVSSFEVPMGPEGELVEFQVGQEEAYRAAVSARQPLYTGGRAGLGTRLAREGIMAARHQTEATQLGVMLGAQEAAYGVLRARQLANVAAARVTALAEHVRNAEALEEAGMAPHFDVVQARTELARAEEEMISAQTAVKQSKAGLRRTLGLPQETPLEVVDPAPPAPLEGEVGDLIELSWQNRPEVQAAETGVRSARLSLELARAAKKPTVALTGEYARQSAGGLGGTSESWMIGVVAEKPILDGGSRDGQVASGRARLDAAELRLQRTREEIALEVVQQFLAVQEARERITTAEQGIIEARERQRMARLRYREGIAAGIEVIDADAALAAAEASLVNAQYDLQLALTRLGKAVGTVPLPRQEVETQ